MEALKQFFRQWSGADPLRVEKLAGAGSNRVYYRLYADPAQTATADGDARLQCVIGCVGTSADENRAFVYLSRHFAARQLPVPQILAVSDDGRRYLQTDLGTTSLFDLLRRGREAGGQYDDNEKALLAKTIRELPRLQVLGAEGLDWSVCYPQPEFDAMNVMFDLNYFKYCFLKSQGTDFHEVHLEHDFQQLARDLTADQSCYAFMYRDFQARNVMMEQSEGGVGSPFFIDYQGGRRGPFYYDVASFLWQASAKYPAELRRELISEYYEALSSTVDSKKSTDLVVPSREKFDERLQLFVLFRTLQVLGAYGFRGYFERKKHFIESIPPALVNLKELMAAGACSSYPYLEEVLSGLTPSFSGQKGSCNVLKNQSEGGEKNLVVRVFSFSYKKGIPADESGNGGGYVFDCRSTHNPGRYEPYKQLTGLDAPVIQFLEDDGEITTFLESVYRLADAHVERYIQRGFTSLMFSFGCTGGQHRSVYSAQHLAEHLHHKYGVEVCLCHREQGLTQHFPATAPSISAR